METIYTEGLVFFTDLSGFHRLVKNMELAETVALLKDFASISLKHTEAGGGQIIKYIGDSALGYFPAEKVDEGMMALLAMKEDVEENLTIGEKKTGLRIGAHYGPFAIFDLEPFGGSADLGGETVNIAAMTGSGGQSKHRSKLIITPEAFRKLKPETRKAFHKYTEPIVYLA